MRIYKPRLETVCGHCGTIFKSSPSARAKFCSYKCHCDHTLTNESVSRRFWRRVDKSGDCWIWTGATMKNGYGICGFNHGTSLVHRVSYQLEHGPIPDGMQVLHRCDVRNCVRPSHLFIGTNNDNRADSVFKGRHARGEGSGINKLVNSQVAQIKSRISNGETHELISKDYGVCRAAISQIARGRNWKHIRVA